MTICEKYGRSCYNHCTMVYIDTLLYKSILMLNEKGYRTKYCCSGHTSIAEFYVYFEENIVIPTPKGFTQSGHTIRIKRTDDRYNHTLLSYMWSAFSIYMYNKKFYKFVKSLPVILYRKVCPKGCECTIRYDKDCTVITSKHTISTYSRNCSKYRMVARVVGIAVNHCKSV